MQGRSQVPRRCLPPPQTRRLRGVELLDHLGSPCSTAIPLQHNNVLYGIILLWCTASIVCGHKYKRLIILWSSFINYWSWICRIVTLQISPLFYFQRFFWDRIWWCFVIIDMSRQSLYSLIHIKMILIGFEYQKKMPEKLSFSICKLIGNSFFLGQNANKKNTIL